MDPGQRERCGMVPVFTVNQSISLASSFAPAASPTVTPQTFTVASPPARLAGFGVDHSPGIAVHCIPAPYPPDLSRCHAYGAFNTGFSRIPSDLARRTQPVWQYQAVSALSALLPILPGTSRIGLRSAPTKLLRQPGGRAHTSLVHRRLTAHKRLVAHSERRRFRNDGAAN
jgi:hypothetical protein